jgi:hypothetical protein
MITTFLQGGLGNQIFQIMAAISHSKKINTDCYFDFSKSNVETQGQRANKYADNLFKNLNNTIINFNNLQRYIEPRFSFTPLPIIDNVCLIGSFQSEKYFDNIKNEIYDLFYFDENKMSQIQNYINEKTGGDLVTSLHIRRGDYLRKPNFHPTQDLNYYVKAMEITNTKKYIVVSDDIQWCKENFIGDKFIFSDFTDEIDDLMLIMNCNHHIIANSSFSWWGAYLCKNPNKIVVAPKLWFGLQGPQDTEDIYINNWIKI